MQYNIVYHDAYFSSFSRFLAYCIYYSEAIGTLCRPSVCLSVSNVLYCG